MQSYARFYLQCEAYSRRGFLSALTRGMVGLNAAASALVATIPSAIIPSTKWIESTWAGLEFELDDAYPIDDMPDLSQLTKIGDGTYIDLTQSDAVFWPIYSQPGAPIGSIFTSADTDGEWTDPSDRSWTDAHSHLANLLHRQSVLAAFNSSEWVKRIFNANEMNRVGARQALRDFRSLQQNYVNVTGLPVPPEARKIIAVERKKIVQFVADERNARNKKSQDKKSQDKKVGTGVSRLALKTPAMLKQPYRYDPDVSDEHREDDIVRDIGEARRDSEVHPEPECRTAIAKKLESI